MELKIFLQINNFGKKIAWYKDYFSIIYSKHHTIIIHLYIRKNMKKSRDKKELEKMNIKDL